MNQSDINTFLTEQQRYHAEHLSAIRAGLLDADAPTFDQWLAALHLEQRDVLRELWDKIVEYDLNTTLEETAQDIDRRAEHTDMTVNQEWANVLGIMEAVRLALGEDMPIRAFR